MSEPTLDRSAIDALRATFGARLDAASTEQSLKAVHDEFLSRKSGSVTALMKTLGGLAPEARREFGARVNELKTEIETRLDEKKAQEDIQKLTDKYVAEIEQHLAAKEKEIMQV